MKTVLAFMMVAGGAAADNTVYTSCDTTQGKKLHSLHKHEVVCPTGTGMRGWRMVDEGCGGDDYRFKLRCSDSGAVGAVSMSNTGCGSAKDKSLQHLDNFPLSCGAGAVLQWWDMPGSSDDSCGSKNRQINFACGALAVSDYEPSATTFRTDCHSAEGKSLQHLRNFDVDCGPQAYLTGFAMLGGTADPCGGDDRAVQFTCLLKTLDMTRMKDPAEIRAENPCSVGDTTAECSSHVYYVQSVATNRYLVASEADQPPVWMPSPTTDGCSEWHFSNAADQGISAAYHEEYYMYTVCGGKNLQLSLQSDGTVLTTELGLSDTGFKSPQLKSTQDYEFSIHETYFSRSWTFSYGLTGFEYYLTTDDQEASKGTLWGYETTSERFRIYRKD